MIYAWIKCEACENDNGPWFRMASVRLTEVGFAICQYCYEMDEDDIGLNEDECSYDEDEIRANEWFDLPPVTFKDMSI